MCFTVGHCSFYPHDVACVNIYTCVCVRLSWQVCAHTSVFDSWECHRDTMASVKRPWSMHVCMCVRNRPVGRETDCILTAIAVISNSCPILILHSEGLCLRCLPCDLPSKTYWRERERERGGVSQPAKGRMSVSEEIKIKNKKREKPETGH